MLIVEGLLGQLITGTIGAVSRLLKRRGEEKRYFEQRIKELPIRVNYTSNFTQYVLTGDLSGYESSFEIFNLSKTPTHIKVSGAYIPVYGTLPGPYSTFYDQTWNFSGLGVSQPLLLPAFGKIHFNFSEPIIGQFGLENYTRETASPQVTWQAQSNLLQDDLPEGELFFTKNQKKFSLKPQDFYPPSPRLSPYRGIGVVINIETIYYEEDFSITRTLYGGVALKSPDGEITDLRRKFDPTPTGRVITFLDNYLFSPALIVKKLSDKKKSFWFSSPFEEKVTKEDTYLKTFKPPSRDIAVYPVLNEATDEKIGCPSPVDSLLIARVGKELHAPLNF